jgi:hypothetical protein
MTRRRRLALVVDSGFASAKGCCQRFNARIHEPLPFSPRFGLLLGHLSAALGAEVAAAVAVRLCVREPSH